MSLKAISVKKIISRTVFSPELSAFGELHLILYHTDKTVMSFQSVAVPLCHKK